MCGGSTRARGPPQGVARPRGGCRHNATFTSGGGDPPVGRGAAAHRSGSVGSHWACRAVPVWRHRTRESGCRGGGRPEGHPLITQLFHLGGGDPPQGWPAPASVWGPASSHWAHRARHLWRHHTRESGCRGGASAEGYPRHNATFTSCGGDPPVGWPGAAHRLGPVGSASTCRAVPVWQPHTRESGCQGGTRPEGYPPHNATFTPGWG